MNEDENKDPNSEASEQTSENLPPEQSSQNFENNEQSSNQESPSSDQDKSDAQAIEKESGESFQKKAENEPQDPFPTEQPLGETPENPDQARDSSINQGEQIPESKTPEVLIEKEEQKEPEPQPEADPKKILKELDKDVAVQKSEQPDGKQKEEPSQVETKEDVPTQILISSAMKELEDLLAQMKEKLSIEEPPNDISYS